MEPSEIRNFDLSTPRETVQLPKLGQIWPDFSNLSLRNISIEIYFHSIYQACITSCMQVAHPHNPQLAEPCHFFSKKEGLFFLLIDHPAQWHPQTAHHLALHWLPHFCRYDVRVRRSVDPAATQVGQNRGKIGVSSVLGDIPRPY